MKYIFVIISLFPVILFASPKYVIKWSKNLDLSPNDYSIAIATDGYGYNNYVAGNVDTFAVIVDFDSSGNTLWMDTINDCKKTLVRDMIFSFNYHIYILGLCEEENSIQSYLTAKYSSSGNKIWEDTFKTTNISTPVAITTDKNDNVYVLGYILKNDTNSDYIMIKYDTNGNVSSVDTIDTGYDEYAKDITIDRNSNVYITGYIRNGNNYDIQTIKCDTSGNIAWMRVIDASDTDSSAAISADSKGNVYVVGTSTLYGFSQYLLAKYDSDGNIQWEDTVYYGYENHASGIAIDTCDNIYITGTSYIYGYPAILSLKFDSMGNILWGDTISDWSSMGNYASGITTDRESNIYITGYTLTSNDSNYDFYSAKYEKYLDAGITRIVSPDDTIFTHSPYSPTIVVRNNSYERTLSIIVGSRIDYGDSLVYFSRRSVYNLPSGDSVQLSFSQWTTPLSPGDYRLSFTFMNFSDMDDRNDTISKMLHIIDYTPPKIDSAIAYDGGNQQSGIDNDDYVILYFSEPTNKPLITNSNIDSILVLSSGHSWLDASGDIGYCRWNSYGDKLIIRLSTNGGEPTIAINDTIIPDSITIKDGAGNPCFEPVILSGSFDPSGISDTRALRQTSLNVSSINRGKILFTYDLKERGSYTINLYSTDGRAIKTKRGNTIGHHSEVMYGVKSGVYFLVLKQNGHLIIKKIMVKN